MEIVPVHSLTITTVNGHLHVTFSRYYHNPVLTLNCRHQDVVSHRPLSVRAGIPSDTCFRSMRDHLGHDVILKLSLPFPAPLDSGE